MSRDSCDVNATSAHQLSRRAAALIMASKPFPYKEKRFSQSQSTSDFNSASKIIHDRREREQKQQTKRRPYSAAPSSGTGVGEDHDRLGYWLRKLPIPPISKIDSGAHSLYSSTGDLELSPQGASLIQGLSEALKSGEESARELRKAEAENGTLRHENEQLREEIRKLQKALEEISWRCAYMSKEYFNIPPNEVLKTLKEVEASTNLDLNAPSNAAHNGDHRSRSDRDASTRTNSGKRMHMYRQQAHKSGTEADAESTSSSSSPNLPKHQPHQQAQDGLSDNMKSGKEEDEAGIACHQGTGEYGPVHTDVD